MPHPMFVTAYYRNSEGAYEKCLMYRTDYLEAAAGKESDRWSLDEPKKSATVVDHTPNNPAAEKPLESPAPAAAPAEPAAPATAKK